LEYFACDGGDGGGGTHDEHDGRDDAADVDGHGIVRGRRRYWDAARASALWTAQGSMGRRNCYIALTTGIDFPVRAIP
jgi:hypothetical protein